MSEESDRQSVFEAWLREKGLEEHPIRCNIFPSTGRGAEATRDIEANELIAYIPQGLLITTQTVHNVYGHALDGLAEPLTAIQWLSVFLILERRQGRASTWQPYIDVLPATYSLPLFSTDDELAALPPTIRDRALRQKQSVDDAWREVVDFFELHPSDLGSPPPRDEFLWAWCAINTRCVYMDIKSSLGFAARVRGKDDCALAPFLDMLNHSCDARVTSGYNKATRQYEIRTHDRYEKGEQVFICYGPHDNGALLLEYGFVLPVGANPHDTVSFDDEALRIVAELRAAGDSCYSPANPGSAEPARPRPSSAEHKQAEGLLPPILARVSREQCENASGRSAQVTLDERLRLLDTLGLSSGLLCGFDGISWQLMAWAIVLCIEHRRWGKASDWAMDHDQVDLLTKRRAHSLIRRMAVNLQPGADGAEENKMMPTRWYSHGSIIKTLWSARQCIVQSVLEQCEDF